MAEISPESPAISLYDPIDSRNQEIRVIHLAPGSFDDEIRMMLKPVHLTGTPSPEYEALSYVWGTVICPRAAFINNEPFTITSNLDIALRHLRQGSQERVLWVDALCINQRNDDEKSLQVQLMRTIYSIASKVTVWMGPADNKSTVFLECVDETAETTDAKAVLESALSFFSRDWFTRVWTVQEFELASKEPEMLCGNRSTYLSAAHFFLCNLHTAFDIHWGTKSAATVAATQGWSAFTRDLVSSIVDWCGTVPLEAAEDYQGEIASKMLITDGMLSLRQALSKPSKRCITVNSHGEAVAGPCTKLSALFPSVLSSVAHLKATLPVDKIYGILGVCQFEGKAIEPDYSRSVGSVYSHAMAHILVSGFEHGYPFWPVGMESSEAASFQLPSWVPDFSRGHLFHASTQRDKLGDLFRMCHLQSLTRSIQDAGYCFPFVDFTRDYQTLYAGGVDIGTVHESWSLHQPGCKASMEKLALIVHQVQQRGVPSDALRDALLGAGNSTSAEAFVSEEKEQSTGESVQRLRSFDASGLYEAAATSPGRTLFLTDNGQIGVTEGSVKRGDLLAGLFGINFPILLRWIGGAFKMVNIAHVANHELGHKNMPRGITKEDLLERYGFNIYAIE
ncbi:hypothetical protein N0V93_003582 [Gnomoniopsis smithogilvyi]|uniref:Heterokaryon incompatibility domain-containing protein n=1 Tax=Gnomoniopsis smithogilvyi TaxID=1191159 RepID=A0A9W8YWX5_9PEZI|nr:hypothetical protein N0V93_003582 [Gnomoniopsis smithogilvyi]